MRTATMGVLLVAALAGCGPGEPRAEKAPPPAIEARLATAEKVEIPATLELSGTVEADRSAMVSSRVMALVTAVQVQVGDTVRAGQVLVEIDPQTASGQLGQARGGLAQAEAALSLAERNFQRFEALAKTDAASQLELDMARTQYEQAKGAVEQARGAVSAASSVAAESRVVAPFAGRVAAKLVEVGDLAAPGRPLVEIESGRAHRLAVAVPESVLARSGLRLGDRVPVAIDARPDLGRLESTLVEMAPAADPLAHTFLLKLEVPVAVPSGSFGRAAFRLGARSAVAVPAEAVLRQGGLTLVVTREEGRGALSRVVTLGEPLADGRVEVLSGLAGGETVLLGLAEVPPLGAPVREGKG